MLDEASKQRVKDLCDQIAKEDDRNRFSLLISELNQIFDSISSDSSAKSNGVDGKADSPNGST